MSFTLNPLVGLLVVISMTALSGCSRDNPLNLADPSDDEAVGVCEEVIFDQPLIEDVHINGIRLSTLQENANEVGDVTFLPEDTTYHATFAYLVDAVRIAADYPPEEDEGGDGTGEEEEDNGPKVGGLKVKVNNVFVDEDDTSESIALVVGENEVTVTVSANLVTPVTELGCTRTADGNDKVITPILYTYRLLIERQPLVQQAIEPQFTSINQDDEFGRSVAVAGDVVAIGVVGDDSSARGVYAGDAVESENNEAVNSGAVYIYRKLTNNDASICLARAGIESNSCWVLDYYLKASNTEAGDQFGSAVSLTKESNGDYVLVVSALGEDSLASGIFAWEDLLGANDETGNIIGDGINDDAAGAAAEVSNLAPDSGAVYVFKWHPSSIDEASDWQQIAYVKSRFNTPGVDGYNNAFGSKVLIDEGVLLVSAPKEDSLSGSEGDASKPNSGAVYVYQYDAQLQELQYHQVLKANVSGEGDGFGQAIALYQGQIVVGAPGEDSDSDKVIPGRVDSLGDLDEDDARLNNDAIDSGAVYVFDQSGGSWEQSAYIKAPNNDAGDLFGTAVALGDSGLWVGAPNEASNGNGFNQNMADNSAAGSGAVYRYSLIVGTETRPDSWMSNLYIKTPVNLPEAKFGSSLVTENNDLLVGAPFLENSDDNSQGRVFGYQIDLADGAVSLLDYSFVSEVGQENARFGRSLAISDTTFVIGSNGFANKDSEPTIERSGRAYVYH